MIVNNRYYTSNNIFKIKAYIKKQLLNRMLLNKDKKTTTTLKKTEVRETNIDKNNIAPIEHNSDGSINNEFYMKRSRKLRSKSFIKLLKLFLGIKSH